MKSWSATKSFGTLAGRRIKVQLLMDNLVTCLDLEDTDGWQEIEKL